MASQIVATCVDSRMEEVLPEILPRIGIRIGDFHRITAFGGSLGLDHEFELCGLVIDNLHPHCLNVLDHLDCKAYRKKYGQNLSREAEQQKHVERLQGLGFSLNQRFPNLKEIRLFLLPEASPEKIGRVVLTVDSNGLNLT